ncbi:aluminum-activated malate transporter 2 [Vitis vinifera]|uniref:Aluminum-activated malate transporter 2 n=2 Tax=Vitis vinifera TaxID=29760 RepID=D7T1P6_VITVI|eukprot:XP_002279322.1 PREDICTED: aluminum-activated malate transporter 2 [Vitis vinifera]
MEMESASHEKAGLLTRLWTCLKPLPGKLVSKVAEVARKIKKLGQDDPRRVIHSLKVGLALTLISLFYYSRALYKGFGDSAMWAVMTVVVVLEFSVGATLGKGLNRGLATLLAGALGVGVHHLASLSGGIGEPMLLGFFVFLQAAASTFARFFPGIKARYDYGCLIFILTFCLVSVAGYRDREILELAHKRISTILIGGATCVIITIVVCPVWAGEDLQNLVALNLEKIGNYLEGFGGEYFRTSEDEECKDDKSFLQGYISVLNSKGSEESLENFARWEPGHGRFRFRHPWKQYLKIGTLTRQCAYRIEALNGYLNSGFQAPTEIRSKIKDVCTMMSLESGMALNELALAVKKMTRPTSADPHIEKSETAAKTLKTLLKSGIWEDTDFLEVIKVATVASLLIDVTNCTQKIAESVHELASIAHFKSVDPTVSPEKSQLSQVKLAAKVDCPQVSITVRESSPSSKESGNSLAPTAVPRVVL